MDEETIQKLENYELVFAADSGDVPSMERLLACIKSREPYSEQMTEAYYWILRLQQEGVEVDPATLDFVEERIEETDVYTVELWLREVNSPYIGRGCLPQSIVDKPYDPFPEEIAKLKEDPEIALVFLIEDAQAGDKKAIKKLLACLENTPAYEWKEWADYYWLLALGRAGGDVDPGKLNAARQAIPEEDRWMVEEWHLRDSVDSPPFTSFAKIKC